MRAIRPIRTALAFLLRTRVSTAAWVLVIGAWHVPVVYDYTLAHQTLHDLEQLAGLLMIAGQLAAFAVCSALLLPGRGAVRMRRERRTRPAEALL